MRLDDFISYEALADTFLDEDEDLKTDISAVHVLSILYCKEMFLDFSVDVFGSAGDTALPLYSEVIPLESNTVVSMPIISPAFVLKMFDARILQLLSSKGLFINWNPAGKTIAKIDPVTPDLSLKLIPEKQ